MFKIPLFGLSSVFYTSCTKKEPYLFIGKTHKFKNCLNLMTLNLSYTLFSCKKSIFNDILYLIHKKTHKNEVKFSEFGITKFNLVVFTISQWDLVLQSSNNILCIHDYFSFGSRLNVAFGSSRYITRLRKRSQLV